MVIFLREVVNIHIRNIVVVNVEDELMIEGHIGERKPNTQKNIKSDLRKSVYILLNGANSIGKKAYAHVVIILLWKVILFVLIAINI